jgi:hypothetical protein
MRIVDSMPHGIKQSRIYRFARAVFYRRSHELFYYRCHRKLIRGKYHCYYWVAVGRAGGKRPTLLFYPEGPDHHDYVLWQISNMLGFKPTTVRGGNPALVINWEDTTHRMESQELSRLSQAYRVVNIGSNDISKDRVERVFSSVFGRSTFVEPQQFHGLCVMKSNTNSLHDGAIVRCPLNPKEGYVYQKVLNNRVGDEVMDIRVPIMGRSIPFVYLKYRALGTRFSNTNTRVVPAQTEDVLSPAEVAQVLEFSRLSGLDYGELDVLRDTGDGLLYIIDVNNTPYGPPNGLSKRDRAAALVRLRQSFKSVFLGADGWHQ